MSVTTIPLEPRVLPAEPAPPAVSVRRGFGWTLAGYLTYMLCQWAMLTILTRAGSPDLRDAALFSMALATVTPVFLFSGLGLRRALATDADEEHPLADYFAVRTWSVVAAAGGIAAAVALFGYGRELALATLILGAAKAIEAASDILHGYFQRQGRIDLSARATIARGILSLAGFVAAFALTRSVPWALSGLAAGWAAVLLAYEWPRARALRSLAAAPRPRRARRPWKLAAAALPLGVVALVISLKTSVPVFVIESRLGVTAVGVFTAVIYFYHGINRVVSALGEAAASRLASLIAKGDAGAAFRLLGRMLGATALVSALGVGAALAAGDLILRLLYGSSVAGHGKALAAVLIAAGVANLQTVLDYALVAVRKFRVQPLLYGASIALLLLMCLAFVPSMGLAGVALALGLSSAAELAAAGVIVARAIPIRPRAVEVTP